MRYLNHGNKDASSRCLEKAIWVIVQTGEVSPCSAQLKKLSWIQFSERNRLIYEVSISSIYV